MGLFILARMHQPGVALLTPHSSHEQFGCTKRQHTVVAIGEASRANKDLIQLLEYL
jgi:hypothetical protein